MNLLLIDDELAARDFVARSLPQGYEMTYAMTLAEGVAMATDTAYDVVLVDLRLQGVENGDALTTMLRVSPDSTMLVLTALHSAGYAVSLIREGADWVTFKPTADLEPETAHRQLCEDILFTKAAHDRHRDALEARSLAAQSLRELRREVGSFRAYWERLATLEGQREADSTVLRELIRQQAERLPVSVEAPKARWVPVWVKAVGVAGSLLAAAVGRWAAWKWGNKP